MLWKLKPEPQRVLGSIVRRVDEKRWLRLLMYCHRRRWPSFLCRPLLRAYRCVAGFQLSPNEIMLVLARLREARNFLVFGVGHDTRLWMALGPAETHFVESNSEWIDAYSKWGDRIHPVNYTTEVGQYRELPARPEALEIELPDFVSRREWDVILVDAPHGYQAGTPGRMQSIYAASRLVRPGGSVLVHDMDREVEQVYAAAFLGDSSGRAGRMGLFPANWTTRPPFDQPAMADIRAVSPVRPSTEIPPERMLPYYRDERVEINIVNFAEPMWLQPRHDREVLLVRDPWYPDKPGPSVMGHRRRNATQSEHIYYLSNTPEIHRWRRRAGFNSHFINLGCFIDANTFRPAADDTEKKYDAAMISRFSWHQNDQLKRHYLAVEVERLALIDPIHGTESSYYRDHYVNRWNCTFHNVHRLSASEVADILRQSHCGLILSAHEGVCRASSEYLLCGLPVVSTPSVGGRDVWYDDYNAIITEPDPAAIKAAVLQLKQSPRDPQRIRKCYLQQSEIFRKRFVSDVLTPVFRRFGVSRDPEEVFKSHPFRWWPDE